MEKEIWGIYARVRGPRPSHSIKWNLEIDYEISAGKWKPGYRKEGLIFVTSPRIREIIARNSGHGKEIMDNAHIYYLVSNREKLVYDYHYYPLGEFGKAFWGSGLSNLIERQVIRDLEKRFPEHKISAHIKSSDIRKAQLKRQGREPGKEMEMGEVLEGIKKQIRWEHEKMGIKKTRAGEIRTREREKSKRFFKHKPL